MIVKFKAVHCFDLVSNAFQQDKNILTKHSVKSVLLKGLMNKEKKLNDKIIIP